MELVGVILLGTITGCYAGKFIKGKGFGIFVDLMAGIGGALLGGAFYQKIGILGGTNFWVIFVFAGMGSIGLLYGVRKARKA